MAKTRAVPKKIGRPTIYTPELGDEICRRLAQGESVNSICKDPAMPSDEAIRCWSNNLDHEFAGKYARARDLAIDKLAEETLQIADDGRNDWIATNDPDNVGYVYNGEAVARSRLRVETRKWYVAKLAPKRYGDRLHVESESKNTNVNVTVDLVQLARDVAFMLAMADAQTVDSST